MSYNRWKGTTGYIYSERLWNGTARRRDLDGKYLPNDVMELDWSDPYDYWSSDALSSLDSGIENYQRNTQVPEQDVQSFVPRTVCSIEQ